MIMQGSKYQDRYVRREIIIFNIDALFSWDVDNPNLFKVPT